MGKTSDFSPRKIGQIRVLLQHCDMRQKEIAQKFNVSPQSVSSIKKSWKEASPYKMEGLENVVRREKLQRDWTER